jgi:alkylation response protein AidB-like acyl-CoA dehydrogenase
MPAPFPSADAVSALADRLAETAVARDKAGGTARKERDQIRESGLLSLSVPRELGGAGAPWTEVLWAVRRISRADSSLGHLFGFHHLMLATGRLFGTPEQWRPLLAQSVKERWFWGNALNPLDLRTTLKEGRLEGSKSFCSGASDSDYLIVSASEPSVSKLAIAAIPTRREGITIHDDWDNLGQRQTDSGSVTFTNVVVDPHELFRTPGPLGSTFASIRPLIAQLVLANVYLGLSEGAVEQARGYTRGQARAWFASGVDSPAKDPYVLLRYGQLHVQLEGARLLTDRAAELLEAAWQLGDSLTVEGRGEVAVAVATAKAATTQAGLELTSRAFDVMGARATTAKAGMDRFWRNLRVHSLHDPVDYKLRDVGDWLLNDRWPTPSFYS